MFSYAGKNEKLPLPSVSQNFFSYPLGATDDGRVPSPNDESNSGLSGGAIAGIVVGVIAVIICIAFLIFRHVIIMKKKTTTTVTGVSHEQKIESEGEDGYDSKLSQLQQQQQLAATTTPRMEYYGKIPDDDTKENTDQLTKSFMDIPTQKQSHSQISTHITPTIAPAIHEAPDVPCETHPRGPQT
ncbi:hypothetical protein BGW42_005846, partial [Actinomortierella wolfii]